MSGPNESGRVWRVLGSQGEMRWSTAYCGPVENGRHGAASCPVIWRSEVAIGRHGELKRGTIRPGLTRFGSKSLVWKSMQWFSKIRQQRPGLVTLRAVNSSAAMHDWAGIGRLGLARRSRLWIAWRGRANQRMADVVGRTSEQMSLVGRGALRHGKHGEMRSSEFQRCKIRPSESRHGRSGTAWSKAWQTW